jgi:hypothetical protein
MGEVKPLDGTDMVRSQVMSIVNDVKLGRMSGPGIVSVRDDRLFDAAQKLNFTKD